MIYNNRTIIFSNDEFVAYKDKLVNKCFAILGIYEDCEKKTIFEPYITYIDRIKIELIGLYNNINNVQLISVINILAGMQEVNNITHKKVKSLVFHIISTIQKMEV